MSTKEDKYPIIQTVPLLSANLVVNSSQFQRKYILLNSKSYSGMILNLALLSLLEFRTIPGRESFCYFCIKFRICDETSHVGVLVSPWLAVASFQCGTEKPVSELPNGQYGKIADISEPQIEPN